MAGPTRKRYVQYEIAARSNLSRRVVEREAIRRWNQWSSVARRILIREFDTLEAAKAQADTAADKAANALDVAKRAAHQGLPSAAQLTHEAVEACFKCSEKMLAEMGAANVIAQFFEVAECPEAVIDEAKRARDSALRERDALIYQTLKMIKLGEQAASMDNDRRRQRLAKTEVSEINEYECGTSAFIRQPLLGLAPDANEEGAEWLGPYLIWQGSVNICAAYVSVDDNQRIVDRFIRKDVVVGEHGWRDVSRWDGRVRDVHSRTVWEAACHKAMSQVQSSSIAGHSNILGYRGSGINLGRQTYTIYTDIADNGSLQDVLRESAGTKIVEPFLWYVFEILIECGLAMQYGKVYGNADEDWREVVHCDIKPNNIFLDQPHDTFYPHYPAPKLADFGISFRTYKGDLANPEMFANGTGTLGYRAPEALRFRTRGQSYAAVDRFELGSHTNVYGVGRTMLALMLKQDLREDPDFTRDHDTMPLMTLSDENHLHANYHGDLVRMVLSCLAVRPEQRSTFRQLHNRLHAILEHDDNDQQLNDIRAIRGGTADRLTRDVYSLRRFAAGIPNGMPWVPRYTQFQIGRDIRFPQLTRMTTDSVPIGRW